MKQQANFTEVRNLECAVFISANQRQLDAAKQVGLSVEAVRTQ